MTTPSSEDEKSSSTSEAAPEPPSAAETRALIAALASCRPDVWLMKRRAALVEQVQQHMTQYPTARRALAAWQGIKCSSLHAYRRVVPLYTLSLKLETAAAATEDVPSDDQEQVLRDLLRGLTRALLLANSVELVDQTISSLLISADDGQLSDAARQKLASMLHDNSMVETCTTSLALGAALDSGSGEQNKAAPQYDDWLTLLLQHSLARFVSANQVALASSLVKTFVTEAFWNDTLSQQLVLKVRSHPDKALPTVLGWIQTLPTTTSSYNFAISDDWLQTLLQKHVLTASSNPKDVTNRQQASLILTTWAQASSGAWNVIAQAAATSKTAMPPTARAAVYALLLDLAVLAAAPSAVAKNNNGKKQQQPVEVDTTAVTKVLQGILALLAKETKADQRAAGQEALVDWMVIAKRNQEDAGYSKALEYIQKPLLATKVNVTDACALPTLLVKRVHPDLLVSMVVDLWMEKGAAKWLKGLEAVVTAAGQKKSAQVEGLVVIYLTLLYAGQAEKPVPSFVNKLLSVGSKSKLDNSSFVYLPAMMDAVSSNPVVSMVLPRTIALYTKLASKRPSESLPNLFPANRVSAAAQALACCILHPTSTHEPSSRHTKKDQYASNAILACLETVLTYQPAGAPGVVQAVLEAVNTTSLSCDEMVQGWNASRAARETDTVETTMKGQGSVHAPHRGFDPNSVRRSARLLAHHCRDPHMLARVMLLMHVGSSLRGEGHQRAALILNTLTVIRETILALVDGSSQTRAAIAEEIVHLSTRSHFGAAAGETGDDAAAKKSFAMKADTEISGSVNNGGLSLLISLGGIASNFSPEVDDPEEADMKPYVYAHGLCLQDIATRLSSNLEDVLGKVERLSEKDVDLYLSPYGTLFDTQEKPKTEPKKTGGKRLNEDEEWEMEMKRELEAKKKKDSAAAKVLSAEEKEQVAKQDEERKMTGYLLKGDFVRALESIRYVSSSDIEVGNACLPMCSESVIRASVSCCPALKHIRILRAYCYDALKVLATSVYEIHEVHAPTMAHALLISCRRIQTTNGASAVDESKGLTVSALPSPCAPAACVIYEMDQFGDALSGASFSFLFPVLQACLMGPRTPTGCDAALRVLERHTAMLCGDDAEESVRIRRKDMAIAVLELLKHDRSQAFRDPSAFDTLTACYKADAVPGAPALTTSELAPLLDERGALGGRNCRLGAMLALAQIAQDHRKLVKSNPLVENRIWLNCFEKDEDIQKAARVAWAVANEREPDDTELAKPSPLFAAPLLPLLSHSDLSIARAAADAFAHALVVHPNSVGRNIEALCKTFVDSVPTPGSTEKSTGGAPKALPLKSTKPVAAPAKKKPAPLPKKRAGPKKQSALSIAGIGKPKTTKKKSAAHSALLKPKVERTLDDEALANQFKTVEKKEKTPEEKDSPSKIAVRLGALNAIAAVTRLPVNVDMDESTLKLLTSFLMAYGIADGENQVKNSARDALRDVVASNGGSVALAFLLPQLEDVLKTGVASETALGSLPTEKIPKDVSASDRRKEGAVVALGSVALHLDGSEYESKVDSTIDMLIATLKTPSEDVQLSVADALSKLMKKGKTKERIEDLLEEFLKNCLHDDSLAVRRGSAYGLSAAVKGSGIATLKKYSIVKRLDEALASGGSREKEGSLFAIELLSSRLGLLFEPYVIVLLPSLLKAFSDSSDHVRTAAANTVGLIMSKLSAHGVKLVMPAVLAAFNDPAWRTKQASIHMLGAMSHLAPKQLASALPKVVPKLTEAFSDTHPKVKGSAQEALEEISTVVRNPEISSISKVLLKALTDPADYTIKALEVLIETEFLHAIDAPSLALIVPILHRGLRDRGATTKRFAGLISANITSMVNDAKEMIPYLPTLLPDLQAALLDPIPDVRSTAAKALGSLTRSLGHHVLPELRPWLIKKLRDANCSSAERSGAAQGLTEVLIVSGSEVVDDTMRNEILPLRSHPEPSTREGVLWMLSFLPPTLGQGFTPLIDISLPALIGGLSDDSEPVRDVAMRAGRVLIRSHGKVHVDKILPSLEAGLGDDDHRIRVASLSLLGDLLSMIGGTTVVKGEGDTQDDIRRAERAQAQITLALGTDTRRRVFSGLYMARSDSVHMVRQLALQVWKSVVAVSARLLREILPVLVTRIIDDLASGNEDKTVVAGRCLGDVVSKLGDSVLPQIIPVLRNSLYDGDEHTKRGVCVGLTDVISCSTKDQILRYLEIIVKVVQDALCDESDSVRKMAATSFQSLYSIVGSRAFDEVVPSLMVALENEDDEDARARALNGLTGILSVRSRELLPYIIPRLIERPITENHAKALAGVVEVTGSTIYAQFSSIIPAILGELSELDDKDEKKVVVRQCSKAVCGYVDEDGVDTLITEIASKCSSDKAAMRRECCRMWEDTITERAEKADFYEQIPIMIREMLYRLNDEDSTVLKANNEALTALSKHVPAEELVKHIEFMRNLLASMVSDARRRKGGVGDGEFLLPGFNMPKGLQPLIPIYQRGILYGSPTIREVSASGLGEAITLTSTKYLAGPLFVKMTGPLLRIVGDRNPSNVKVAILKTLGLVLVKGGPALRAFVPQFQTTFVKALSDPSRQVRLEAIGALSLLMPLSTRVDPLIKELVSGSLGNNNAAAEGLAAAAVQTATLEALATVLEKGGAKAKLPASVPSALEASKELVVSADEGIRDAASKVMGASCALLGADMALEVLQDDVLPASESDSSAERHGAACCIRRILASSVGAELDSGMIDSLSNRSKTFLSDDSSTVREAGAVALLACVGRSPDPKASFKAVEAPVLKILANTREPMDLHRSVARGFCVALLMLDGPERVDTMGLPLLDACLKLAMSGAQRVQFAFNDALWLALDVQAGQEGLDRYAAMAVFDNVRSMRSLHSKVLTRIKEVTILED